MNHPKVHILPQRQDNYAYLVVCQETYDAAIVDCPDPKPMIEMIETLGANPISILNTHHHWDHTAGNRHLTARWPRIKIYGHTLDKDRIPGLTFPVNEGDVVSIGKTSATVLFTPGHTSGHIAYHFAQSNILFCGDTLFYGGCGRIFEGTPLEMHNSLQKLGALKHETLVYCGHEYTLSNLRFALSIDPQNPDLLATHKECQELRQQEQPTLPTTIGREWKINPFLRTSEKAIQDVALAHGADLKDPASIFAKIRELKDVF